MDNHEVVSYNASCFSTDVLELDENQLTGEISDTICARRGDGRTQLNELTVDCDEVVCDCCTNCDS